jgi:hypothetical protein
VVQLTPSMVEVPWLSRSIIALRACGSGAAHRQYLVHSATLRLPLPAAASSRATEKSIRTQAGHGIKYYRRETDE